MFGDGKTRAEFCDLHNISSDTFEDWKKQYPLFSEAYRVAIQKAQAYYDRLRRQYLVQEFEGDSINWAGFNRMYNVRFNVPDKRAVTVKMLARAKDERAMLKSIMKAISDGELTPDEAQKLANLIDISLKVKQAHELEERISAIEEANKIGVDDDGFEEVPG